jgi:DnaD/phage-associated family protein
MCYKWYYRGFGSGGKNGGHLLSQLTIYQDSYINATILSNRFIDEYMTDANDAQLKVYLYTVRMMSAHLETSITDIADRFNYTEKDVLRAFKYWQCKGLLELDFDESGALVGVHLKNLCKSDITEPSVESTHSVQTVKQERKAADTLAEAEDKAAAIPAKPSYTPSKVRDFKTSHTSSESGIDIFYLAEEYRKKPLSPSDIGTIIYICEELGFSDELFDHLLQYCASKDKSDFRYIEKVAISWKESGITTPREAENAPGRYDRKVYEIMRQLGKTGNTPTDKEVSYITKWTGEYGFTDDIILEACERTVMATEKNRFQYADKILKNWKDKGVGTIRDIDNLDKAHEENSEKNRTGNGKSNAQKAGNNSSNMFNRFTQRTDYDFEALEKKLIKN